MTRNATPAFAALDVLAFGLLLGELLDRCGTVNEAVRDIQRACVTPDPAARPRLEEVADALPV